MQIKIDLEESELAASIKAEQEAFAAAQEAKVAKEANQAANSEGPNAEDHVPSMGDVGVLPNSTSTAAGVGAGSGTTGASEVHLEMVGEDITHVLQSKCVTLTNVRRLIELHKERMTLMSDVKQLEGNLNHLTSGTASLDGVGDVTEAVIEKSAAEIKLVSKKERLSEIEKEVQAEHGNKNEYCTGYGIVIFRQAHMARRIIEWYNPPVSEVLWQFLSCSGPPSITIGGKGVNVGVEKAPEPEDVIWENFEVTPMERLCRAIRSNIGCFLVLGLSFFIIVSIEGAKLNYREDNITSDSHSDTNFILTMNILGGATVAFLNFVLRYTIEVSTTWEQAKTRTAYSQSLMRKLIPSYCVNTVFVWFTVYNRREKWYDPGDLAESSFYIAVFNIVPHFLLVTQVVEMVTRNINPWNNVKTCHTQSELNRLFTPPKLDLAEAYAAMIKTVAIGVFFGPGLPILYPITALSLTIFFWAWKYALVKVFARPPAFSTTIAPRARMWVMIILFIQIGTSYWFYQPRSTDSAAVTATLNTYFTYNICFYICFMFCPWGHCCGQGDSHSGQDEADRNPFPDDMALVVLEHQDGPGSWSYVVPTLDNLQTATEQKKIIRKRWTKVNDAPGMQRGIDPPK